MHAELGRLLAERRFFDSTLNVELGSSAVFLIVLIVRSIVSVRVVFQPACHYLVGSCSWLPAVSMLATSQSSVSLFVYMWACYSHCMMSLHYVCRKCKCLCLCTCSRVMVIACIVSLYYVCRKCKLDDTCISPINNGGLHGDCACNCAPYMVHYTNCIQLIPTKALYGPRYTRLGIPLVGA